MEILNALKVLFMYVVLQGCVVVMVQAAAPVLNNLPNEYYVGEQETGSRLVYTFSIQDPNGDAFTVANAITAEKDGVAVNGTFDQFEVKLNSLSSLYELWTTGTAFDFATVDKFYNAISATDTNNETSTAQDLVFKVVENEQVTINNVEGAINALTINALNTGQGVTVKTVSSTSALGSEIEFSMVSDPSFVREFFTIDPSTGKITTNRELKYLDSSVPTVYLYITAFDRENYILTYATQVINLINQNTICSTANMINGVAESQIETLAAGTVLFTMTAVDPDAQTLTYRHECSPRSAQDTFEMDANGNFLVATGRTMDYEEISFFNCSFYCDDGIAEGGPFVYELTVANDNEAPYFSDIMYYASVFEGLKGSVTFDPTFDCSDDDVGDSITYEFNSANNSDRFAIDSNGLMTFNTDYDVDNSLMTSTAVLTVNCVDSGHIDGVKKTGTAKVTITIYDANDNEPIFPSTSYTIIVSDTTEPGTVIGTITPTDDDSTSNADEICQEYSSTAYSSYFAIGANCNIYLTKTIDFASGTTTRFVVHGVDDGNPKQSGTTTVELIYQASPTTTTTTAATTTEYNFFHHSGNIALFIFALLMGLALLGLLTWCLMNFCCGNVCGNRCFGFGRGGRGRGRGGRRRYPERRRPETPDSPSSKYGRQKDPYY